MTISDAERRGIVESLRLEADDWNSYRKDDDTFSMSDSDFTESILVAFGFDGTAVPVCELFDKLADLVDWPTCRIGYVPGSADRSCSACGVTFSTGTYQGGDHEEHEFMFCPNCGAEVVRTSD